MISRKIDETVRKGNSLGPVFSEQDVRFEANIVPNDHVRETVRSERVG